MVISKGQFSSEDEGMIIGSIPFFLIISILLGEEDAKIIRLFIPLTFHLSFD